MTNFEKIKNMGVEELAKILVYFDGGYGYYGGYGIDGSHSEETAIEQQIKYLKSEDAE